MFKYKDRRFEDKRFGKAMRFGNSFTAGFQAPVQIMRQYVSNNGQYQTPYPPYQRYKGLSSMPNLAGIRQTTLDTKQSYIYKHYMFDIGRYKGLADMKV